jgi:pilus assembly protein CpaB
MAMMRRRGTILVVLSLAMGLLAAWGANNWVSGRLGAGADDANVARMAAAALSIAYGTKIEDRHVRMIEISADAIPDGAVLRLEDAVGKVATLDIQRGELLLAGRLADHHGGSTLASLVTESMRAITVRVDDVVGVAGFLLPGNFVDVVSSRMDSKTRRATTETILKSIKVLAVDQTASTNGSDPVIVRAVTLEVSPEQSLVLVKAKDEGTIQLTLRNPRETHVAETRPVEEKRAAPVAAPVRARAPTTTDVQVIRGTRIDQTKTRI